VNDEEPGDPAGRCTPYHSGKRSNTGCIESFEVTFTGRISLTGFKGKKDAVGMVLADIRGTAPE
jgi:hypothetical protein